MKGLINTKLNQNFFKSCYIVGLQKKFFLRKVNGWFKFKVENTENLVNLTQDFEVLRIFWILNSLLKHEIWKFFIFLLKTSKTDFQKNFEEKINIGTYLKMRNTGQKSDFLCIFAFKNTLKLLISHS